MDLLPIPAFDDNYLWLLHDGHQALVVDPGDEQPVLETLQKLGLQLAGILVTHHHGDHTGGVAELRQSSGAQVFGPKHERMPEPLQRVGEGDRFELLGCTIEVVDVPGHTKGHIAYIVTVPEQPPILFCGDTLFSAGCGRLFEGTPAQMLDSLSKLARLPDDTRVCCAHEYTTSNLKFASAVEPGNDALINYAQEVMALRAQNKPSLPSSIAREKAINPFLRSHLAPVISAVNNFDASARTPQEIFGALRAWKNQF